MTLFSLGSSFVCSPRVAVRHSGRRLKQENYGALCVIYIFCASLKEYQTYHNTEICAVNVKFFSSFFPCGSRGPQRCCLVDTSAPHRVRRRLHGARDEEIPAPAAPARAETTPQHRPMTCVTIARGGARTIPESSKILVDLDERPIAEFDEFRWWHTASHTEQPQQYHRHHSSSTSLAPPALTTSRLTTESFIPLSATRASRGDCSIPAKNGSAAWRRPSCISGCRPLRWPLRRAQRKEGTAEHGGRTEGGRRQRSEQGRELIKT